MTSSYSSFRAIAIAVLIVLLIVVYAPGLRGRFVWDDEEQVVNNRIVHDLRLLPKAFQGSTFNDGGSGKLTGAYYKPMMTVFFSFLYAFFGENATSFHVFQWGIHVVNTLLIFLILLYLYKRSSGKQEMFGLAVCTFLAAVFAIHPLQVETVIYISALQDVLFMFFGLCAFSLVLYLEKESEHFSNSDNGLLIGAIATLLFLSLLSKETGILFYGLIFFWSVFFLRNKRKLFIAGSVLVAFSFLTYLLLRFGIAGVYQDKHIIAPIANVPFFTRLQTMPAVWFQYITQLLLPVKLSVSWHYVVREVGVGSFVTPLLAVVIFVAGVFVYVRRVKKPEVNIFAFMLLCGMLLHSHIIPLDMTAAERWMCFNVFLVCAMVLYASLTWPQSKKSTLVALGVFACLVIVAFSVRSFMRSSNWVSGEVLYFHDLSINPTAYDLQTNVGVMYSRADKPKEALSYFLQSIESNPRMTVAYNNAGAMYERLGEDGKALEYYNKALELGTYPLAVENRVGILIRLGRIREAKEALAYGLMRLPNNERLRIFASYLANKKE